jgi:hypothetical protein
MKPFRLILFAGVALFLGGWLGCAATLALDAVGLLGSDSIIPGACLSIVFAGALVAPFGALLPVDHRGETAISKDRPQA